MTGLKILRDYNNDTLLKEWDNERYIYNLVDRFKPWAKKMNKLCDADRGR